MGRVTIQNMQMYHCLIDNLKHWDDKLKHIDLSRMIQRLENKGSLTPNQSLFLKKLKKQWKYDNWTLDLKGIIDVESEEGREQVLNLYIDEIFELCTSLTETQVKFVYKIVCKEFKL